MKIFSDDLMSIKTNIDGRWVIKKPLSFWTISRFKQAWDVFIGKAVGVYFKEDL